MYNQDQWSEYKQPRRELRMREPRAILNSQGTLTLNGKAKELLGDPEGVILLFDVRLSRIGVKPEVLTVEHAHPLLTYKKSALVHMKGFCNSYGIRVESTIEFRNVCMDSEGVMLLDLTTARRVR